MTLVRSAARPGRIALLACTALVSGLTLPGAAHAQNAGAAPQMPGATPAPTGTANLEPNTPTAAQPGPQADTATSEGLQEIVVTAQKREQRLQDVPIAITAISQAQLQANRVVNVGDLSGLAPSVTVRETAGGAGISSFTSRGITSYGVVPGSDKEFSIYLDGVYIATSRSLFDLPDIQRIEVLRGPQGTLFGRNATSGAVSVVTRDPAGTFGVHQDLTVGNYDQLRTRTSIDTPTFGAFSAYVSYVHDERRGDIRNLGAGTVWDRTGPNTGFGVQRSPRRLGDKNLESVFAAVKFEPSDNFRTTYKFDYGANHYTPNGQAVIAYGAITPNFPESFLLSPLVSALITSQPTALPIAGDARRPDAVNNSFTVRGYQKNYGHNLTSELRLTDDISIKNIASYRYNQTQSAAQISGAGGLIFTPQALVPFATLAAFSTVPNLALAPAATQAAVIGQFAQGLAPAVGQRFIITDTNTRAVSKQWSEELQANYNSRLLTLTVGGIYFHQKDVVGGPVGIQNTLTFALIPQSGRIPLGNQGVSYNKGTSIAGYAQAEVHVTDTLDLVAGGRLTHDRKSGSYEQGGIYVPPAGQPNNFVDGTFTGINSNPFTFRQTKFTYSGGANYKPNNDLLFYAKYSTGFVSGGSVAGIGFKSETVRSVEGGIKADWFDRRLRTNLAVYNAVYDHLQSAQGGAALNRADLGTVIIEQGKLRSRGVELEVTAAPVTGVTLTANGGYVDAKASKFTDIFLSLFGTGYKPTLLPKWTSSLSAQYDSRPIWGDAKFTARADANWRSRQRTLSGSFNTSIPEFRELFYSPQRWIVNTRVGFRDVGPLHLDVAFWTRNLNNSRVTTFPLTFRSYIASSTFEQARTYGLDVSMRF